MKRLHLRLVILLGLALGCGGEVETPPVPTATPKVPRPSPKPKRLTILPASWTLQPGDDGIQFVVSRRGTEPLKAITWRAQPEGILAMDRNGYARPVSSGTALVEAVADGLVAGSARVSVSAQGQRPWDFATDVVPIFTRYGCNSGGCHGRAEGQGGFHLSLFGYDSQGDYQSVTRAALGRRVDRIVPEQSLLLRKATGQTPHGGGPRLRPGSDAHRSLTAWLHAGAPESQDKTHGEIVDLTVEPARITLSGPGVQQLRVVARHKDGHLRDVTRYATFQSNNDSIAMIDDQGFAALIRRGETDLIVRFGSEVVSVRLGAVLNPEFKFDFAALPHANVIDEQLFSRLAELRIPPSPPAEDDRFLRRVSLDLTGQLPLPDEIRAFLADSRPDRRSRKIDELMERPEFLKNWELRFGDLLQITSARFQNGAGYYQAWLQSRLRENARWDAMVRELLTTMGNPNQSGGGAANYALDGPDPMARAERTAQRFLGLRMRCAQCHDHPFDIWTQEDYFGFAAFFARTEIISASGRPEVRLNPAGVVSHPRTGLPVAPRFLRGDTPEIAPGDDPRRALADWITRPDNPYFARAMANWMWAQFFGRGIVEPADDMSAANPPVHPALLDAIAKAFIESGYDLRALMRMIVTSTAYGLSSRVLPENAADTRAFSHYQPRPLTAHQLADAIAQATDVPNVYANRAARPGITRAIDLFDPATPSLLLDALGRCPRTIDCQPSGTPQVSLRQMLLLIGGDTIDARVSGLNGYLSRLLEYGAEPSDIVENLYLRTLSRLPNEAERSHWTEQLTSSDSIQETAEDLFWALLNSREFAFNH